MLAKVLGSHRANAVQTWMAAGVAGVVAVSVLNPDWALAEDIPSESIGVALVVDGDENVKIYSDSSLKVEAEYDNPEGEGIVTLPQALDGMTPVAAVFVVEGKSKVILECVWVGGRERCKERTVE